MKKTPSKKRPAKTSSDHRDRVLVLRTCSPDYTSHGGFKWPKSGPVKCQDWMPDAKCGNGLHGLLWGEGDAGLLNWRSDAVWQVVEVDASSIVKIDCGKVKFPAGNVLYSGTRLEATDLIVSRLCKTARVVGCSLAGGDGSTLTGGDGSTLTGGDGHDAGRAGVP